MRLLKVSSVESGDGKLELAYFVGRNIPPYAILSHTWGDDEVLFTDIVNGSARGRKAFQKVKFAADQAREDDYEYIWIDTCCIDKSSSAELQEAINSMYAWYAKAKVCYAYLVDVTKQYADDGFEDEFKASRWFTRGWTLQELLAPRRLFFFSGDWTLLMDIDDLLGLYQLPRSLSGLMSEATGIKECHLDRDQTITDASIATRMSWASSRKTTRKEDMAYCL